MPGLSGTDRRGHEVGRAVGEACRDATADGQSSDGRDRLAVGADEQRVAAAEDALRALGLRELRVRHHDTIARIEVPVAAMSMFLDPAVRERVSAELKRLGYLWVTLDLAGFRSGSLNDALPAKKHEGPEG